MNWISQAPTLQIHALIEKDGDFYSALCLELDVASQGEIPLLFFLIKLFLLGKEKV